MGKYAIDKDFFPFSKFKPPVNAKFANMAQKSMGCLADMEKSSAKLTVDKINIPVGDGTHIDALVYTPTNIDKSNSPCVVVFHGGGFVYPAAPYHYALAKEYALSAKCKAVFVNYRLAPNHKFPTPIDDCFSAYCYVLDNAKALGINKSKIAVTGDSAGGMLSALTALYARDAGVTMPCGQMLIYPVLDQNWQTPSMLKFTDTPMCNAVAITKYFNLCTDDSYSQNPLSPPMEYESLANLPATYIETAQFDCLHDDGENYANRLKQFGIDVTLNNTVGTMHGFDIKLNSQITRQAVEKRIEFLKKVFE